jgi:hypothetical protein
MFAFVGWFCYIETTFKWRNFEVENDHCPPFMGYPTRAEILLFEALGLAGAPFRVWATARMAVSGFDVCFGSGAALIVRFA